MFNTIPTAVPVIVDSPQSVVAITDDEASFNCSARGKPTPTITWWRDGVMLQSDDKFEISSSMGDEEYYTSSQLLISSIDLEDADTYICIAGNPVGQNMASATLDVQSKLKIIKTNDGVIYGMFFYTI